MIIDESGDISMTNNLNVDGSLNVVGNMDVSGTVSGTWNGNVIDVAHGGTGVTTLDNLITLGTHTTGNYVSTITGGDGISSTGNTSGESVPHLSLIHI